MRVLFLTHRLPFAPNRGDRIRAFHILRALAPAAEVRLVSLAHDADEAAHRVDLDGLVAGVEVVRVPRLCNLAFAPWSILAGRTLTHALLGAPRMREVLAREVEQHRPDVVLAYCSSMAWFALERPLDQTPFVLDMVDVDSEKWSALGSASRGPMRWVYRREARLLARFEAEASRRADAVTVVNAREQAALVRIAPGAHVHVAENGIDLESFRPADGPAERRQVIFCGVMQYAPNAQASLWLAREVWPRVRQAVPDANLVLVGSDPPRSVRALADAAGGVEVTGTVPSVRPYLWSSAVAAAPLQVARGIQNKVLEALAAGLPCVVTRPVWDGLPDEAKPGCLVADDAGDFARQLVEFLRLEPAARRERAALARLDSLDWPRRLAPLVDLLRRAADGRPKASASSA